MIWVCAGASNQNAFAQTETAIKNDANFEAVATILIKRCLECHNERDNSGGLSLHSLDAFASGGESGEVFSRKDPHSSYLLERIILDEMPPEQKGVSQRLPDSEIKILKKWLESGAKWPKTRMLDLYEKTTEVRGGRDWWSLQKIVKPKVPTVGASNPVDAFIQSKLSKTQLSSAPPASKRTLIRRLYIGLIGVPPTKSEITSFENDDSPMAYQELADRLLASPLFGQRMARHWLDQVRYADTSGYERDQEKPFSWRYRDWVVEAFNSDMPYDQFLTHQLAGDVVQNSNKDSVIATGFLRIGTWNDEPNDPQEYKYDRLEDLVHTTSTTFLGLTVKCARCHDHKFDPILQTDYYKMASVFWDGPIEPAKSTLLGGPSQSQLGFQDVLGWTDVRKDQKKLRLLHKGDPKKPLQEIDYTPLNVVAHLNNFDSASNQKNTQEPTTKSPRLELANWMTDKANPLVARVAVNRIWQQHFGEGIVRSPNNFGYRGTPPTHPKLLDYLAATLVENQWRTKKIHRLILSSETYRQSSIHPKSQECELIDSANEHWWRFNQRRLDAESIRDAMLKSTRQIDLRFGGKGFRPSLSLESTEGLSRLGSGWKESPQQEQRRRSLYIFSQRTLLVPMMTTFDFQDTTTPCGQRDITTVAPQALAMMNNQWVHQQAESLAADIRLDSPNDVSRQIELAWNQVLSRNPTAGEKQSALVFLKSQSKKFLMGLRASQLAQEKRAVPKFIKDGLGLHYSAQNENGESIQLDEKGRVKAIENLASKKHDAAQSKADQRPLFKEDAINGLKAIRFDGKNDFLHIEEQVLDSQQFSIFALVNDAASHSGHREIFSNWDGSKSNSGTSLFLGMTGEKAVRLGDPFSGVGYISDRNKHFILSASNGLERATLFQNHRIIASRPTLPERNLNTGYVIGQQGNINGEYWRGDLCELLVYDRSLNEDQRRSVTEFLGRKYRIDLSRNRFEPKVEPAQRALASLCQVLFNTNEFVYVD